MARRAPFAPLILGEDTVEKRLRDLGWKRCRHRPSLWRHRALSYPWPKGDALRLEGEWSEGHYEVIKLFVETRP